MKYKAVERKEGKIIKEGESFTEIRDFIYDNYQITHEYQLINNTIDIVDTNGNLQFRYGVHE